MESLSKFKEFIVTQVGNKHLSAADATEFIQLVSQQATESEQLRSAHDEVAVVGYDCRLPAASSPEMFWDNMINNKDCVSAFPRERMDDVIYINQDSYEQYKLLNCRVGGYLDSVDCFDYEYFGISPIEARDMDPSHRIFLETAVGALQHAGLTKEQLNQSRTGVFIGYSMSEDNFADLLGKENPNLALGNQPAMMAYRLAFMYNFKGPTMAIDTTCSSSLVALHMARQSILNGDCEQAVVAGVNLRIFPAIREISNLGIEAFDGRCRPFDADAAGTNIGDGIVTVVLKRKADALAAGDHIHGLILGSAINSDGASNGLSAPNPEAQADVLKRAWDDAGIQPQQISFIETHGTGTKLGDPIEIHGLTMAARHYTQDQQFIPLSGTKANIGHLEATAGIAGFLKALLSIKHRQLPTILHFQKPNPYIDFASSPVFVPQEVTHWQDKETPIVAGVSSFGITGTNSHMVLAEHRAEHRDEHRAEQAALNAEHRAERKLVLISANSKTTLLANVARYLQWLDEDTDLDALSYSTTMRSDHYTHRLAFAVKTQDELRQQLQAVIEHQSLDDLSNLSIDHVFYAHSEQQDFITLTDSELLSAQQLLLENYLSGQALEWQAQLGDARFMPLPPYSFERTRCWPKLTIDKHEEQQNRIRDLFYDIVWKAEPATAFSGELNREDCQLLFLRPSSYSEALVAFLNERQANIRVVYAADQFEALPDGHFYIRADAAEDYQRLFKVLADQDVAFDTIIHGFDWCQEHSTMETYDQVLQGQVFGAMSMYRLINALAAHNHNIQCKLITLSTNAHEVTGEELDLDPSRMTALGVNKVISQEYPMIESIFIDCDVPDHVELQLQLIYDEAIVRPHLNEHILAIRHGERYRQILARIDHADLSHAEQAVIQEGSVHLIAGGAGYLGMETALHLANKAKVKIAIGSRSDYSVLNQTNLPDTQDDKLAKMIRVVQAVRELGSEICFIQGDVTDAQQCESVVQQCREQYGPINGIFVAIKNISHKRLNDVSAEEFEFNIFSKLKGVYLLDQYTSNDPVELFVNFSSISSLTGGPTGADCSASNLFLDSYGDYRNRLLGKRTMTLNYTLIDADNGSLDSDRLTMIPPLTKDECFQCMDVFLETDLNFAVMADFASSVTHKVLPYMKVNFDEEILAEFEQYAGKKAKRPQAVQSTEGTPAAQSINRQSMSQFSEQDIRDSISEAFKAVLGHNNVKPFDNFFEIGGDSISAVKLIDKLNNLLQAEVQVSILYDCPSVADLTQYFLQDQNATESTPEEVAANDDIGALLDQLDEGEVSLEELAQRI